MDRRPAVLAVDDDQSMLDLLVEGLGRRGFSVTARRSPAAASEALEAVDKWAVVVTDLRLGADDGIEFCRQLHARWPDVPVIVITAFGGVDTAVAAMRAGAWDFATKPLDLDVLALALRRAVEHHDLRAELRRVRAQGASDLELVGASPIMRRLHEQIARLAETDAAVLISGETGTGKELVARELHRLGPRRAGPFVAVDCAAIPEPLLESELFGHERGAFTDAKQARVGLLAHANGGTVLLDEIGDMPAGLQPKLLRALQERVIRPVGSTREVGLDVRVLAATHRDLEEEVEQGRFRQDLYFRVNVVQLHLPPLRARGNDVLLLAHHLLGRLPDARRKGISGLAPAAAEHLLAYDWPGNVRELYNCLERAVALTSSAELTLADLPERVREHRRERVVPFDGEAAELLPLAEVERRYILRVLAALGGNKAEAARTLGLDRKTLYRKLERWQSAP